MKTFLVTVVALLSVNFAPVVRADEALLFAGKCKNVTHDMEGFLKLFVIEKSDGSLEGYMSISGWLSGSGLLEGIRRDKHYEFKTRDAQSGVAIRWEGFKKDGKVSGEYYVDPIVAAGLDKQVGEWEVISLHPGNTQLKESEETFKSRLMLTLEAELNAPIQMSDGSVQTGAHALFNTVHPVGNGVSVSVDDVEIEWKEGASKNSPDEIRRYKMDYTLYWHGLLQVKGHTKLRMTYNVNLGEVTSHEVVSTTGTTTQDAKNMVFDIGLLLGAAVVESFLKAE